MIVTDVTMIVIDDVTMIVVCMLKGHSNITSEQFMLLVEMDVHFITLIFLSIFSFLLIQKTQGFIECDLTFLPVLYDDFHKILPDDVPTRKEFINRNIDIFQNIYTHYIKARNRRIIDDRTARIIRDNIRNEINSIKFEGINMLRIQIAKIEEKAKAAMIKALDEFRAIACSIDCPVTEGPVIDAFTCDLIMEDHCYGGEVCGVETFYETERRDIIIFIAVLVSFAVLMYSLLGFTIFYYCAKRKACIEKRMQADIELGETKPKESEGNGGQNGITTVENESETEESESKEKEESESQETEESEETEDSESQNTEESESQNSEDASSESPT